MHVIRSLFFLFAFIASTILFSSNSYALELSDYVSLVRGNMTYNFAAPMNISNCQLSNYNQFLGNPNQDLVCYIRSVTLEFPSESYQVGDYLAFPLYVWNNQNNNSSDANVFSLATTTSGLDLVSADYQQLSGSVGVVQIIYKVYTAGTYTTAILTSSSGNAFANLQYGEYLSSGKATHYRPIGQFDTSSIVNAINSQPNYTQSLNNIRNDIQNLQQTQEQANDDANDRYEDEKQTIQDNADQAQQDAEDFTPSFSIPNPLTNFFNAFTDNRCVDIPDLASWLHSNETHICSPWPSNVRSVMTTVVSGLFGLIIFRFVVKWFMKNQGESE